MIDHSFWPSSFTFYLFYHYPTSTAAVLWKPKPACVSSILYEASTLHSLQKKQVSLNVSEDLIVPVHYGMPFRIQ